MGATESLFAFNQMQELRNQGIACELFHEPAKMDKQFKYADKKFIPYVVIIGTKEIENEEAVVKNLATSEQQKIPLIRLAAFFKEINQ
jgi:histidyl-tRNA synthetase